MKRIFVLMVLILVVAIPAMAADVFSSKDENTLSVTKTEPKTQTYEYGYLLRQKKAIEDSRDAELAIINNLIAEADKLNLKEKEIDAEPIVGDVSK